MHGQQHIKIYTAKQAKDINRYKTTKIKLYRINAAIWFNKTCKLKQLMPNYINWAVLHKPTNHTVVIRDEVEPVAVYV